MGTAEVIMFPVPSVEGERVADLEHGFTRIANELLEAVMLAGLSQHQLLVFMAVMRKTYGFNKKSDWVSNEQLSLLTGILSHKCSAAKCALVRRKIFIQTGRSVGINKSVSEWKCLPESGKKNKVYPKEVILPESGKESLPESGKRHYPNQVNTKDTIQKKERNKRSPKPPQGDITLKSDSGGLTNTASKLIDHLNRNLTALAEKQGRPKPMGFRHAKQNITLITARLKEFSQTDCELVTDYLTEMWGADVEMREYLCPTSIFRPTKFDDRVVRAHNWNTAGRPVRDGKQWDRSRKSSFSLTDALNDTSWADNGLGL